MTKINKLILFCVLAFFILGAFFLPHLTAQDITTLDNGLRVVIKEDHRSPIVVFSVFVDIGSAKEGEYLGCGISHLIEHMLFKGPIEDILHKYGGKIDGWTSFDYTGYRIVILKEHASVALGVIRNMLMNPVFDKNELKKEMGVIKREMALLQDDPGRRISRLLYSNAFTKHPYRIPIIGHEENFEKLEREDLSTFFKKYYTAGNILICVVGDIEKEEILNKIESNLSELPRGKAATSFVPLEPPQIASRYIEKKMKVSGAYLSIGFHSTDLFHKDLYALDVLSFILGQGESSRLNEKLRIKEELLVSIGSYNFTPKDPGLFVISGVLEEENVTKAIDKIWEEIEAIKNNGVTNEELEKAKTNAVSSLVYQKETLEAQAYDLALNALLTGTPEFTKYYVERLKSVSGEDIQEVTQKYLSKKNMTVALVNESGNILGDIDKDLSGETKDRKIKKITLGNLPVLICEDPSVPLLSMALVVKGGLRMENKDNNGISELASLMLMDGTETMTREELSRFYEERAMHLSTYSGNNSFGITLTCLKENKKEAFDLLSNICLRSTFPKEELLREKKELHSLIDMQDNTLFNQGHRLLKEHLFRKHPYGFQGIGTHESIDKIRLEDITGFHKNLFSADNMVFGISGDMEEEDIKSLIEECFLGVPSQIPDFTLPQKEPSIEKKEEALIQTDKEESLVLFGFHGIDIYDKDKYALEVMVHALSSASGRLFKKIRDQKGLSYAQGAFHVLGIDPGYIVIYTLTSKQNIEKVKALIAGEITSLKVKGITPNEMEQSKNLLKAEGKMGIQSNASFIFQASLDELYGLGYNHYKDYDKNIENVTNQDIKRVAKRLLTLDGYAILILEGK